MDKKTDDEKVKDILKALVNLQELRRPVEPMVDDIIKYVVHGRRKILDTDSMKGQKTGIDIYDGAAISALSLLRDGLCGYTASKSFHWFDYTLPSKMNFPRTSMMRGWTGKRLDEYDEVKQWLEDCEEVMYAAFLVCNFYDLFPLIVQEGASIGTANVVLEEDLEKERAIFILPHFRECFIAENRFGEVDTNYRVSKYSLRQLKDKFGMDKMKEIDPNFDRAYENNPYADKEIIHAVYPRNDYNTGRLDSKSKKVASIWVSRSPDKIILESGYDENPCLTWRWWKNSDEIYGRSPAWDAFVEIMKANEQGKTNLIAGHKMAEPPMMTDSDLRGKVNIGPKGWTWIENNKPVDRWPRPVQTNIQLPFAIDQQERSDKIIREHFHTDFFLLLSQAAFNKVELTATQVIEMGGEKAAILGTRIGKLESELLNPTHDRLFEIERRFRHIPQPPQILLDIGGNIEVDYLGPLAQAQKRMFKSQVIRAGFQTLAEASQIYPEVAFTIDPIKTMRDLLEAQGFPVKDFRTQEEVDHILQIRDQKRQEQEMIEKGTEIAKALPKAGKATEPGSPLAAMMGQEGNA